MVDEMRDTSRAVQDIQLELWRRMSPQQRLDAFLAINRMSREALLTGLRERYPEAADDELRARLCALLHGDDLARTAYGWSPDVKAA